MELFALFSDTDEGRNKRARLLSLRSGVIPILANNLQTEFTDHSVAHSDNVCTLIERLAAPLQTGTKPLTDHEACILYAAAYLHDIGMQYENAGSTSVIAEAQLASTWETLTREERGSHLRWLHNKISAELVVRSRNSAKPPIGFQLNDSDDPGLIAALCEGHILDVESDRYKELMDSSGSPIRMRLLSGLLRMADILDESQRRANRPKAESLLLPVLSQAHWFRHYYTKDVNADIASKTINLRFVFPHQRRDEYSRIVPALSVPEIENELRRHSAAFAYNGLTWTVEYRVDTSPYSDADEMPAEIAMEMLAMLQDRAAKEAHNRREAMLREFEQAQPVIERMLTDINQLPPDTPPLDKARRLTIVAERLRKIHATHSEVGILQSAYDLYGMAQDVTEQLDVGLRLIDLLFSEGLEQLGCHLALDCERIIANANIPASKRLQLEMLKARGLGSLCAYDDAYPAYRAAIDLAQSSEPRLAYELSVELGELQMLSGDLEVAAETLLPLLSAGQQCDPLTRSRAVAASAYLLAYRGSMDEALETLDHALAMLPATPDNTLSLTLLLNTKARLLYLDCRADQACDTLQRLPEGLTLSARPEQRLTIESNHKVCQLVVDPAQGVRLNDMYRDARRLVSQPRDEIVALLEALEDQRAEKHPSAFARFWKELQRAYASGDWQRYWFAEEYFAEECLHIGQPAATVYHAVQGLSEPNIQRAATSLLAGRNPQLIRDAIEHAMASRLSGHFVLASLFLEHLADAAPADMLETIVNFLLPRAGTRFIMLKSFDTVRPAWRALKAFAFRLNRTLARQVLDHIRTLDYTRANEFVLQEVIETLRRLIARLEPADLPDAAAVVLPFVDGYDPNAIGRVHYVTAINTACHIAHHASDELKRTIGDRLFPPGASQCNAVKMQILPYFKDVAAGEWADALATQAIEAIRSQVREEEGGTPAFLTPTPGSTMAWAEDLGNGRRRVISAGADLLLHAALAHLERTKPDSVQALLQACLDMALMEVNQPNNRVILLQMIPRIADIVPPEARKEAFTAVLTLAKGEGIRQEDWQRVERNNNPLNPFKFNMGSPTDVRGSALCCLARLLVSSPETPPDMVWSLLEEAIVSPDANLRLWATFATEYLPHVNDPLFTALVFGLRDPVAEVAVRSYASLTAKQELSLDSFKAGLIMTAIRFATDNSNAELRRAASALCKRMRTWLQDAEQLVPQIEELLSVFSVDICCSVREAGSVSNRPEEKSE